MLSALQGRTDVLVVHLDTAVRWREITDLRTPQRLIGGSVQAIRDILGLCRLLLLHRPDLVHLCSSASFAGVKDRAMVFLAKTMDVPTVVHYRLGRIPSLIASQNWEWKLIRLTMRAASCVLLLDARSASEVRREVPEIKIELIPNPIDPKKVEDAVAKQGFADNNAGCSRIVYVGHIVERKGIRDLVRACMLLPEGSFQLNLVGFAKPDFQLELAALARARSDGKWLIFHGEVDRVRAIQRLHEADLVAFPSYTEGFPNALLEAMTLGKPIVATNVGAIPEMLGENTNEPCGLLVQPGQAKELMQALVTLMTDKERARMLGERARRKALACYTVRPILERYISAWKSVSRGR